MFCACCVSLSLSAFAVADLHTLEMATFVDTINFAELALE